MKKLIFYSIIILFVFVACSESEKNARIIVKLESIDDDYLLLSLSPIGSDLKPVFDTLPLVHGKASFELSINEPHRGYILSNSMFKNLDNGDPFLIRSKAIEFFIDHNQTIIITGEIKEYMTEYKAVGSLLNVQFTDFNKTRSYIREKHSKAMYLYENCFSGENPSLEQTLTLEQEIAELLPQIQQYDLDYILSNPENELSAFLLSNQHLDTIQKYYETLSAAALETNYGRLLKSKTIGFNIFKVGDLAPVFEHKTLHDEEFRLNDYLGSPVVLYFWGTWCAPCQGEIPKLKEFYLENNEKLKLVGIACKDNRENLTSFIEKHDINWTQLLNIDNSDNDLSKIFGVKYYPTKILLNKDGHVNGIFIGATEEFYTKIGKLMNE